MPFNNNTLDDLFREKDKELPPDTHRMDAHWDQMQQMLAPSAPVNKSWRKWMPVAGIATLAVGTILFLALRGNKEQEHTNTAMAKNERPAPAVIPSSSNNQPAATVQSNAVAAAAKTVQPEQQALAVAVKPVPPAGSGAPASLPANAQVKKGANGREYIELPQQPQIFHISGNRDTSVLCQYGTTIKIPANSLADSDGNTIDGDVTMIVQEYYRYEDIIAAGLNRNAEMKKKSITAGMVKFDAYRDEQKLDVKPGRSIEIRMRKDLINIKAGQSANAIIDNGDGNKIQDLNIHNLGWISYERFYNDARPVTDIRIQIPKNVNVNQLISQLAFISVQGVMPGYIENNQVVFYNIPIGEKAWFISLGTAGKKFLSCVEQLEIKGNDVVIPNFRETSPEQFKRQLEMLTALPVKER